MKSIPAHIKKTLSTQHHQLLNIWEKSIRATHDFLNEQQILQIQELIIKHHYFDHVQLFHVEREQKIVGFIGLAYDKIEMLFIAPQYFHQGIEATLIQHAVSLGIHEVDVNEQNVKALAFYQQYGFRQFARSELDAEGNPFPILHLRRKPEAINDLDYHDTEVMKYK
ncbi:GNAT family N-acetyltransferase [Acinetobacter sp. ANC 4648]|uniref:GNAT family N-acetyltransferase n=1 Tax=Acinetobacter sp. ANC 4648 TaxID=1977875 RepID=UPI000A34E57A|nr:GNAT family N-acetyltransferase [Acinetobacter sp. ANC 4648]OTG80644.1 GNAT family N-acetyltransferase [Acinetobacter sp. ANC 4648]